MSSLRNLARDIIILTFWYPPPIPLFRLKIRLHFRLFHHKHRPTTTTTNSNDYRIVSSTVADHQANVFHKIHRRRVLKRVKLFLDDGQVDGILDDYVIIR